MINFVNLLNITKVNMLFTILLIGWPKKVIFFTNIIDKNILTKNL